MAICRPSQLSAAATSQAAAAGRSVTHLLGSARNGGFWALQRPVPSFIGGPLGIILGTSWCSLTRRL